MKLHPNTPAERAKHMLAIGLAALLTATPAFAQTSDADSVRRLQEENATLRRQLAEMQGRSAPAPTAQPVTTSTPAPVVTQSSGTVASESSDPDTLILSPFEVKSSKDYGYLKTNAATATRIGMEIQNIPMNINVMSEEFIKDTGMTRVTDIFRYTSSGAADGRFAMRVPANSATPQGAFTMRGFTVNTLLRNGVFRYTSWNLDNVDRVEVVKGPAAVFFGQGYPGGVINYVTKKPSFTKIPTTISYQIGSNLDQKVLIDTNQAFSEKAAFRVTGAWTEGNGDRRGEFNKNFNVTPSLTLNPFKSGKLRINLELEYLKERFNYNDNAWTYPQGWFDAYKTPTAALMNAAGASITGAPDPAAAYRTRIFSSLANYITDYRNSIGDPTAVIYTPDVVKPYATITDKAGNRVVDKDFNFTNSGAYSDSEVKTFQGTVDFEPVSWLSGRYTFTADNNRFDNISGGNVPNADGITWNALSGGNGAGYYRRAQNHQLDLVAKADFWKVKNKLLFGAVYNKPIQQYMASAGAMYNSVPGYNTGYINSAGQYVYSTTRGPNGEALVVNPINPGYAVNAGNNVNSPNNAQVPMGQYLVNRNGVLLTPQQVYNQWDPGILLNPPASKVYGIERNIKDGYNDRNKAWYANWQLTALDDKLTFLAGYRKEYAEYRGQWLEANAPWFIPAPDAYLNPTTYPPAIYNYSPAYQASNYQKTSGDAYMVGASYAITPQISVYATVSSTFRINTGRKGDFSAIASTPEEIINAIIANNPGGYTWKGHLINSVQSGLDAFQAEGVLDNVPNEEGMNREIGVKLSTRDNKLVGTLSFFKGERKNQKLDDAIAQSAAQEPLNSSSTVFALGTVFNPSGSGARVLRWRTVGVKNEVEGTEFDLTWTPIRNLQIIANGAWMWDAHTVASPSFAPPGSTTYNTYTATQKANADVLYNSRLVNVPEFRASVWGKYSFTDSLVRGLGIGAGARYASEEVVTQNLDWNPLKGGFQAGDYVVFDANISYPWELFGYQLRTDLSVQNVTDKVYYEGTWVPSDPRTWFLKTTFSF
ncbi:TonB-dependent siderophore receptor [Oleiharenicola lentus]|uniref:TonB-dependent siderophore receptor n=1 Tax=Oleiharenicola lentus TaxID=2508720 RepID=UPI003F66A92B